VNPLLKAAVLKVSDPAARESAPSAAADSGARPRPRAGGALL